MSPQAADSALPRSVGAGDEPPTLEAALRTHDRALQDLGLAIWVGSEPTFTDRRSEANPWLAEALGGDKEARARKLLSELKDARPEALILRTLGRRYPGEAQARWSYGLYARRDGASLWPGPDDPLDESRPCTRAALTNFCDGLIERARRQGWTAHAFQTEAPWTLRLVLSLDGATPARDDARLLRPSLHNEAPPPECLHDALAEEGIYLFIIDQAPETGCARIELPAFDDPPLFARLLHELGESACEHGLPGVILRGYPPPVDAGMSWMSITPDPAVVEINMAPSPDSARFLTDMHGIFVAANSQGLSPYRLQYNGEVSDSGGGGQMTLGGPSASDSPFFRHPRLLPDLLRYFNRHPALSYYFASDFIGASSQAPRPDESPRERFDELDLTLALLDRQSAPTPETLWRSLSPFLCDTGGNAHRSEINIEKLWNPHGDARHRQGLVEFRALRMQATPEHSACVAALLRASAALMIKRGAPGALKKWGRDLHERFALPYFLRRDLQAVLADLRAAGLALGAPIEARLLDDEARLFGGVEAAGCRLSLRQALDFWPLVGDAASQEQGASRWVDASTQRLELRIESGTEHIRTPTDWDVRVAGYRLPMRLEQESRGDTLVFGLRYRRFVPWHGLHPTLAADDPIEIVFCHRDLAEALRVTLYEWRPGGGAYRGLPKDFDEARRRRAERFVVESIPVPDAPARTPPAEALTPYGIDLRRLANKSRSAP